MICSCVYFKVKRKVFVHIACMLGDMWWGGLEVGGGVWAAFALYLHCIKRLGELRDVRLMLCLRNDKGT
jgi:hypothetical protein